jgi:hypothetical protein
MLQLSAKAELLSKRRLQAINVIVEIEGWPTVYGAMKVLEIPKFDNGLYFDDGWNFDGMVEMLQSNDLISLDQTTKTFQNQIFPDKEAHQSVQKVNVEFLDENNEISNMISPGIGLDEVLGNRAKFYLNYGNGAHPEDSVLVHSGCIDGVKSRSGSIIISISSNEAQKRQKFFIKSTTKLTAPIGTGDTTIFVEDTSDFLDEQDSLQTYFIMNNEVIRYTGKTPTSFTGCVRAQLNTQADSFATGAELNSFYRLQGQPIELALKLMLSPSSESLEINTLSFVEVEPGNFITGGIHFENYNIQESQGLVVGDSVTISGSLSNDGTYTIESFGTLNTGSYIVVNSPLVIENNSTGVAVFKSKYDTLSEGLGMKMDEVDVAQHESIVSLFGSSFPSMDHYVKDTIEGRDFLHGLIYFPVALYPITRKSKASVAAIFPPFSSTDLIELNEDTVIESGSVSSEREVGKNFYDSVLYKFDDYAIVDKFQFGLLIASGDTRVNRVGNKPYIIECGGIRDTLSNRAILETIGTRILQRYKNAAELFPKVKIKYSKGLTAEVGDKVLFGSENMKLTDITSGDRKFTPRLVEIMNKELSVQTGEITVDLMSTGANLRGRYASIAPQSYLGGGSTTNRLELKTSPWTTNQEFRQWSKYFGEIVLIHNPDFTFQEERILLGVDPANNNFLQLDVPLSTAPLDGWSITAPEYSGTADDKRKWKLLHCYLNGEYGVLTGVSNTAFTVSGPDALKFSVNNYVQLFKKDFSSFLKEVKVLSIVGPQINTEDMGGVGDNTYNAHLIGYTDGGYPYRLI